jgi:MerR family transcriptional regulator, copper efflux regulator
MENSTSYSISEAAELLKLSAKTIRRYIKSGKLPSIKVPTKFGDEYRITEIPENLQQEAQAQAEAESRSDIITVEEQSRQLDAQQMYQDNIRLAAQLGAATERIRQMEEQLKTQESQLKLMESLKEQGKLLEAPKETPRTPVPAPWWKRLFHIK